MKIILFRIIVKIIFNLKILFHIEKQTNNTIPVIDAFIVSITDKRLIKLMFLKLLVSLDS